MQLGYGNVTKPSKVQTSISKDAFISKTFNDPTSKDYVLVLVEQFWTRNYLSLFEKLLTSEGVNNFVIASIIKETSLKDDHTETLIAAESNWKKYLSYEGKRASCVIALGDALTVLNKNGDINWTFFINTKFTWPRYYCGSEFCNGPDLWVYPLPPMKTMFPIDICPTNPECAYTRFARKQLHYVTTLDPRDYSDTDLRDYKLVNVDGPEEAHKVLQSLKNSDLIAFDTETSGFFYKFDQLGTFQVTNDGVTGYTFRWKDIDPADVTEVMRTAKQTVAHNGKFDKHYLLQNGVGEFDLTDDTMQLCWIICSDRARGLKPNTILYVGKFAGYDDHLDKLKKKLHVSNYLMLPWKDLSRYAGLDSITDWRLLRILEKQVKKIDDSFKNFKQPQMTLYRFYKDIMMPNQEVNVIQEEGGVYHNFDAFEELREFIEPKIKELHDKMVKLFEVPDSFQFTSSQLAKLFKDRNWPPINGEWSSSDEALTEYKRMGYPGIDELKEWRSWNVGLNTYYKGWKEYTRWEIEKDPTGRDVKVYKCHPSLNSFSVTSMRHAETNNNYQQIPSGSRIAKNVRKVFDTPPSEEYWAADGYDNIEYQKVIVKTGESKYFWQLTEEDEIVAYDESSKRPIPYTWYKA